MVISGHNMNKFHTEFTAHNSITVTCYTLLFYIEEVKCVLYAARMARDHDILYSSKAFFFNKTREVLHICGFNL